MADLHHVLRAVLDELGAAPPATWKQTLVNATFVELSVFLAKQLEDQVTKGERAVWNDLVALAEPVRAPKDLSSHDRTALTALFKGRFVDDEWGALVEGTTPAMSVALLAAVEARRCDQNASCGVASRHAAVIVARELGEDFVPRLDAELRRLDAVTVCRQHDLDPGGRIEETLWRGTTGLAPTHWLVRLDDGSFGLVAKLRGRWAWLAGSRDDVLASVPDALMPSAMEAVLGGAAPTQGDGRAPHVIELDTPQDLISIDGDRVLCAAGKRLRAFSTLTGQEGSVPSTKPTRGPAQAFDPKAKAVTVEGVELKVDKPGVQHVARTASGFTVVFHGGARAAFFDARGTRTHVLSARSLGESIDRLFPLTNGLVLGFAPWPKGTVALIDRDAKVRASARLGRYYVNPQLVWQVADGGATVAFTVNNAPTGPRLVIFREVA
jgi:hypothetical protein